MKRTRPHLRIYSEGPASLPGVQVFNTGVQRGKPYTERDLHDMVANFKRFSSGEKPLVRVPAVLGHEETQEFLDRTDLPAAAWAKNCYVEPARGKDGVVRPTLFVDFENLPPKVKRLLKGKAYATVSAEIYDEPPDGVPGKGKMLRRVAFLGGDIPQVKSLDDIPEPVEYAESTARFARVVLGRQESVKGRAGTFWCFSEATTMDRAALIKALADKGFDPAMITEAIPDEFLTAVVRVLDGTSNMDDDPEAAKKKAAEDAAKLAEGEMPPKPTDADGVKKLAEFTKKLAEKYGCKLDDMGTAADTINKDPAMNSEKFVKLSELPGLIAKGVEAALKSGTDKRLARIEKFADDTEGRFKKNNVDAILQGLLKEGRVTPKQLDRTNVANVHDELMRTDASTVLHKFTDKKTGSVVEMTAFDLRVQQLREGPVLIKYSERVKGDGTNPDGEEEAKVAAYAERPEVVDVLKVKGETPQQYVAKFNELRKKDPTLTAARYGVSEAA